MLRVETSASVCSAYVSGPDLLIKDVWLTKRLGGQISRCKLFTVHALVRCHRLPTVHTTATLSIQHASGHISTCPMSFGRPNVVQTVKAVDQWLLFYGQLLGTIENPQQFIAMTSIPSS